MTLQTQPTRLPTRKITAVILSGAVMGALQSGLALVWPDHPFAPVMDQIDIWVQTAVMAAVGYMVRERDPGALP
jgi:hypothetical protein